MRRPTRMLAVGAVVAAAAIATPLTLSTASAGTPPTPVVPLLQKLSLPYPIPLGKTDIYAVHGLNLANQTKQSDRGTPVTVCAGNSSVLTDFQFGDVSTALTLDTGSKVDVKVFSGANQSCSGTNPLISQTITVPNTAAAAIVATSGPGTFKPVLQAYDLAVEAVPVSCLQVGAQRAPQAVAANAVLQANHAAAAGTVDVLVNDASAGQISFGETLPPADVPAGTYKVQVNLNGTPIVPATNIPVEACTTEVVYVVGNQQVPEPPTTTTSTTVAPTTTVKAAVVTPRFTG